MPIENLLSSLSPGEKVAAMNYLWGELSAQPAEFSSPAWHGDVLADRDANPSREPRLPLDAAMDDVKERLNGRRAKG
ncbi:addiction module protein [Roseimaritima sediminicola]|uniref:addiction module protein n=1 Tax=Roseimaritima sediminicola TaxID=2662066 RepID=UPI00138701CE|nr:addiction module protein [Roseimaritima sediminicola]